MKMTNEVLEKARSAENSEALWALAKGNGMEITQEEAQDYYERLHKQGELSDQELENVTGGCGGSSKPTPQLIPDVEKCCQYWTCMYDGSTKWESMRDPRDPFTKKFYKGCVCCKQPRNCVNCKYCMGRDYQGGEAWFCYHGIWK